jgi:cytochrome c556
MKKIFIGTLAACLIASTAVYADEIADRKAAMKNVGFALGALVKMFKGEVDYDPQMAVLAFSVLNNATIGFPGLFPPGTETGGKTNAGPKIWEDMDGFKAAVAKAQGDSAAAIAAKPADLDSFKVLFRKVAKNCNICHETYRLPLQ